MTTATRFFAREIAALDGVFEFVSSFAGDHGIDERTRLTIDLVIEELFTNLVRHNEGGGDHIELTLDRTNGVLRLELVDDDVEPFDPETVAAVPVDAGISARTPGGLGMHLVRKMVDSLHYSYEPETRTLRVSVTTTLES